jgi:hypothetical protein
VQNCQELLALHKDQEGFFARLVNVDGSWFHYQTSVVKRQSMRWKHDDSPCPKKFQTAPFAGKEKDLSNQGHEGHPVNQVASPRANNQQ